jgi:two-component system NarL family response regulator
MRVLLADDHPLFIEGLRSLLSLRGLSVVGTAEDGLQALEQARVLRPELILLDIQMQPMDGLSALRLIKAEFPETKVVMLTMSAEDEELFEALKSGACGYLLKTVRTEEFFDLLEEVARGEVALSSGLAGRVLREFGRPADPAIPGEERPTLSARELEVLTLVAHRLTYKEVGARLLLSERTIKHYMGQIIERLHLHNRAEVIEYARRTRLIRSTGA